MKATSDDKSCYSMGKRDSESMSAERQYGTRVLWSHGGTRQYQRKSTAAQVSKVPLWEENSLYPVMFILTGYLTLTCGWSIITIIKSGIHVAQAFATLILWHTDVSCFSFMRIKKRHSYLKMEQSSYECVWERERERESRNGCGHY